MSTNPNTKAYWRRVSRMAGRLMFAYGDKSVTDIIAAEDPLPATLAEAELPDQIRRPAQGAAGRGPQSNFRSA